MNEKGLLLIFILAWYYLSWNSCDLSGFYKHLVLSKNEVAFLCVVLFGTWLYFVVKRTKQEKFSSLLLLLLLSNLRSLGLALQFLQFQAMLLFAKAPYYSLHLTSSARLPIFSMSFLGLQLQLSQPQLKTSCSFFFTSRLSLR